MQNSQAWCALEAQKIYKHINGKVPKKGFVLFETGYGPSGLPHIGTFGEVVRTSFVKFAFETLYPEIPTKLYCVSDDIDGMRKIPENIPNKDLLKPHIKKPLIKIPDPFQTHESYGHHMNARLRLFLDSFNFEYEFISAGQQYKSGMYNQVMLKVLEMYDKIMNLMLPTLGDDRRKTYSPFMPICNETGQVLEEGVMKINQQKGTIVYRNSLGDEVETEVINGNCKLQWKIDFGARWHTFGVDYEIFGKDHLANESIYKKVCAILGTKPPVNFCYELFLGEDGAKISKSKGNGISVEEWMACAPAESLKLFMFQKPKTAKKLYFASIPKAVDEYIAFVHSYHKNEDGKYNNPVYYVHSGDVPKFNLEGVSYSLMLNLASVCNPENDDILWGFIQKYAPHLHKNKYKFLDEMVAKSINYYTHYIKPYKTFLSPTAQEQVLLLQLLELCKNTTETDGGILQNAVYKIAKDAEFDIKQWFSCIYNVLLGQSQGPRVGSFIALYGTKNMANLIEEKLSIF
ncbi:MAG: lysyl-tRNA synthetase class 1 [Candidatus Deianiraeaceae bacterium]|jgi:lysyl-tRNA synthetase class 1